MCELEHEDSWVPKNWCFWTVVLKKTLDSPLDCKNIQPVHPKGDHSWVFIGRTDIEAETPILWPPDGKSWFIWKNPDAGKDWRLEEKGMTEDEIVGWHHWLNRREFEWTPRVGDGQGGLACCSPWGRKMLDMTEQLNWTELNWYRSKRSFPHFKWFVWNSILLIFFFFVIWKIPEIEKEKVKWKKRSSSMKTMATKKKIFFSHSATV